MTIAAMVAWFAVLAPTSVGGATSYIFVVGESMQPLMFTGDLAVARKTGDHAIGDVVYFTTDRGPVIHRIVDGDSETGWITQGDNVSRPDNWVVPDEAILGEYWFHTPNVTPALMWTRENPLLFGLGAAALALIPYLPWRRRRLPDEVKVAMTFGVKEPRRDGRTTLEYVVAGLSYTATVATLALVASTYASKTTSVTTWALALGSFAVALSVSVFFLYRLYDGVTVAEPSKSMYALAGRLYLVEELPPVDEPTELRSAIALRTIAEQHRLPVLHRIDPITGRHSFLLITARAGSYTWSPPSRRKVQEHPPGTPSTPPSLRTPPTPHTPPSPSSPSSPMTPAHGVTLGGVTSR